MEFNVILNLRILQSIPMPMWCWRMCKYFWAKQRSAQVVAFDIDGHPGRGFRDNRVRLHQFCYATYRLFNYHKINFYRQCCIVFLLFCSVKRSFYRIESRKCILNLERRKQNVLRGYRTLQVRFRLSTSWWRLSTSDFPWTFDTKIHLNHTL